MPYATTLLDFESFYAKCEKLFRPDLRNRHAVVLSNNDGCVVAFDKELKEFGLTRGKPFFKVENMLKFYEAEVFSSNYAMYGKISDRAMQLLQRFTPDVEEYSIDEAFMLIDVKKGNFDSFLHHIQEQMEMWTGLRVRLGAGVNKVYAKMAQKLSKSKKAEGIVNLYDSPYIDIALERTLVQDIWKIGKASAAKLNKIDIKNAKQFREARHYDIRKLLTMVGARVLMELKGKVCFPFEKVAMTSKNIGCSRSFGMPVTRYEDMRNSLIYYLSMACARMRRQNLAAKSVTVLVSTDRFRPVPEKYAKQMIYKSTFHSIYQEEIQEWVIKVLNQIYRQGYEYKRAGILLGGLMPAEKLTKRLFDNERYEKLHKVNLAVDRINHKFGRGTVQLANVVSEGNWQMKQQYLSPNYTSINQMPVAY
ncbi:MAG TPA: Y-family DNA polymerase [Pyrinomonadaceae bacterium]|nr:Y-family DNA polymerase [Pyrinomonadaceae bacterium]